VCRGLGLRGKPIEDKRGALEMEEKGGMGAKTKEEVTQVLVHSRGRVVLHPFDRLVSMLWYVTSLLEQLG